MWKYGYLAFHQQPQLLTSLTKLHIDKDSYNAARYKLQKILINKKEHALKKIN